MQPRAGLAPVVLHPGRAALVGGLAEVIGVPGAFCLLVALPVAGMVSLLTGGPDSVEPATG
jgi:hypothetical protein